MEHFTKAIQNTIRKMGIEFVEALAEIRGSADTISDFSGDESAPEPGRKYPPPE